MKRLDYLILLARNAAKNEANPDGSYAIPDVDVVQYFNDAQDYFQAVISGAKQTSKLFSVRKEIPIVANQEEYSIPDRLYINKGVHLVEYSYSGLVTDYRKLRKLELFNSNSSPSEPVGYYRRNGLICLVGVPSTSQGKLRVTYERQVDDLDIRRGQVDTITGLTSTTFTNLTVTAPDTTSLINLSNIDYICFVDDDGNRKAFNVKISFSGGFLITPDPSWQFESGDTISSGDYVVLNKYTTTHSQLPDECETFMVQYAALCLKAKDNGDLKGVDKERLDEMATELLKAFGSQTAEVQEIPQDGSDDFWYE